MPAHLKLDVSVEIRFGSGRKARNIINALIPDNVKIPKGLSIKMENAGPNALIEIATNDTISPVTLLNTLDEILEHIAVADKVSS